MIPSRRAWLDNNKEHLRAYNKARWEAMRSDPTALEKKKQQQREYRQRHKEKLAEYDRQRERQKLQARSRVRNLIYEGRMERGCCAKCGAPNAQAHHEDYSQPLNIKWLCPKHHKELHYHE